MAFLVPYNVFTSEETEITKTVVLLKWVKKVDKQERLTRRKFRKALDEDEVYSGKS
jgi:hypothetical protein